MIPGLITVPNALQQYADHLRAKGNREYSILHTQNRLVAWFKQFATIEEITQPRLERFYQERAKVASVDTHRNELCEVKTFFRWAQKQGIVRHSPVENMKGMGKRNKGKRQLHRAEAQTLFDVAYAKALRGHEGALAVLIALLHGLRSGEVRMLQVRDFDNTPGCARLYIEHAKTPAGHRQVALSDALVELLEEKTKGRSGEDLIFPSPTSSTGVRDASWFRKVLRCLCRQAKVPVVCVHGLRGTYATLATDSGIDGNIVARALGHVSVSTTYKHYVDPGAVENQRMRRVMQVFTGGERKSG